MACRSLRHLITLGSVLLVALTLLSAPNAYALWTPAKRLGPKPFITRPIRPKSWLPLKNTTRGPKYRLATKGPIILKPLRGRNLNPIEIGPNEMRDPAKKDIARQIVQESLYNERTRRTWSDDFLSGINEGFEKYAHRTWYVGIPNEKKPGEFHSPDEHRARFSGGMGVTLAKEGEGLHLEEMKDERDGHQWTITENGERPPFLFEYRSLFTSHDVHHENFPELLSRIANKTIELLGERAEELQNEKLIYSYASGASIEQYRRIWGFEVLDTEKYPPIQKGTRINKHTGKSEPMIWQMIRISPREVLENRARFLNNYILLAGDKTTPMKITLPGHGTFAIKNGVSFSKGHQLRKIEIARRRRYSLGIWLNPNSEIIWNGSGEIWLRGVSGKRPGILPWLGPRLIAREGSDVKLWADGSLHRMETPSGEFLTFEPGERPINPIVESP